MRLLTSWFVLATWSVSLASGCGPVVQTVGSGDAGSGGRGGQSAGGTSTVPDGPTRRVTKTTDIPKELQAALMTAAAMDGATIMSAYPIPAIAEPTYDATTAAGMELIQASSMALNANELEVLAKNGLVISKRKQFPSFAYGYKSLYAEDLPLYVSADSVLEALHRTFDSLLKQNEQLVLIPELASLLDGMRARLAIVELDATTKNDADLYLTVASGLAKGTIQTPAATADASQIAELYDLATAGEGHLDVKLFGVVRDEDFSQFTPRGHYTDSPELERYFRAMMWLGRVDLRLIETQSDGSQLFYRQQFDAAVALRALMGDDGFRLWKHIDTTIGAYVGEHDSMTPEGLDGLMAALNVGTVQEAASLSDQEIIDEIASGGWGAQRIASRIIYKGDPSAATLPLDRSFMLFGQRYTVDSHAFVNVTYDRVEHRMMPKPLDAAFAAFGNNSALTLLSDEFDNHSYVAGLAKTRALVDAHESSYWESSLYTRWLGALRSLSPRDDAAMPTITRTPAWQKRILSTQLGSWAELRHDTILYVKQSYTTGNLCEFPDAYVDPYPEFYAKLGTLADAVATLAEGLPDTVDELKATSRAWVTNFKMVTTHLQHMAENQLTGTPHSAELMAFINDAVRWDEQAMCGGVVRSNLAGWYLKLYLENWSGIEADPVVADVHTQVTDEAGNDVGRILHVGVGDPRLMVVTAETCQGPRAYAGLAFSYGELITENWKRLNDQEWSSTIVKDPFPDPAWMSSAQAE